ncbi:hypothetical protein Pint_24051 [Pistacia integerrima]|uniref:Uncharacterized protein n=1 Tax=Pistacia integerrima TaxID=434235 RepID=A0ACC0YM29_9ROSI|nr:hypothetical protein Pint_24051 [Pistacia integerrima]
MAFCHFNLLLVLISALGRDAAVFTLQNKCEEKVWPGILTRAGKPQLANGGLTLNPGQIVHINAPTGCLVDGYNLPISIIPSGGTGDKCKAITCVSDLNQKCPNELQQVEKGKVVGCKSACMAFNKPELCCTDAFGDPNTCKPTQFSKIFKESCPMAYSYAYDDLTTTFTCNGANYLISFC